MLQFCYMNYEIPPQRKDADLSFNDKFPFIVDLGPKTPRVLKRAEKVVKFGSVSLMFQQSMYLTDEATRLASDGFEIEAYRVGSHIGERIDSALLTGARTGKFSREWLSEHASRRTRAEQTGRNFFRLALDLKSGVILNRLEQRVGLDQIEDASDSSFEVVMSGSLLLYFALFDRVAHNGFTVAKNKTNGTFFYLSDNFFDPPIDEEVKLRTVTNISDWTHTFLPDLV